MGYDPISIRSIEAMGQMEIWLFLAYCSEKVLWSLVMLPYLVPIPTPLNAADTNFLNCNFTVYNYS